MLSRTATEIIRLLESQWKSENKAEEEEEEEEKNNKRTIKECCDAIKALRSVMIFVVSVIIIRSPS